MYPSVLIGRIPALEGQESASQRSSDYIVAIPWR